MVTAQHISLFSQWWWEHHGEERCSIFHCFSRSFVVLVVVFPIAHTGTISAFLLTLLLLCFQWLRN